jgi:DUF1680 family protein
LYWYNDDLSSKIKLAVNGRDVPLNLQKGFARIARSWKAGDLVTMVLPSAVRRVVANPKVSADQGRFAVERGPLVYCAEGADNDGKVLDKVFSGKVSFQAEWKPELLGGVTVIRMQVPESKNSMTLIPYYAWCHRGPNEMRVWFPTGAATSRADAGLRSEQFAAASDTQ